MDGNPWLVPALRYVRRNPSLGVGIALQQRVCDPAVRHPRAEPSEPQPAARAQCGGQPERETASGGLYAVAIWPMR